MEFSLSLREATQSSPPPHLKDFNYLKKLGASKMSDYNSKIIVDILFLALKSTLLTSLLHTAEESEASFDIVDKVNGIEVISIVLSIPESTLSGIDIKMI